LTVSYRIVRRQPDVGGRTEWWGTKEESPQGRGKTDAGGVIRNGPQNERPTKALQKRSRWPKIDTHGEPPPALPLNDRFFPPRPVDRRKERQPEPSGRVKAAHAIGRWQGRKAYRP